MQCLYMKEDVLGYVRRALLAWHVFLRVWDRHCPSVSDIRCRTQMHPDACPRGSSFACFFISWGSRHLSAWISPLSMRPGIHRTRAVSRVDVDHRGRTGGLCPFRTQPSSQRTHTYTHLHPCTYTHIYAHENTHAARRKSDEVEIAS